MLLLVSPPLLCVCLLRYVDEDALQPTVTRRGNVLPPPLSRRVLCVLTSASSCYALHFAAALRCYC